MMFFMSAPSRLRSTVTSFVIIFSRVLFTYYLSLLRTSLLMSSPSPIHSLLILNMGYHGPDFTWSNRRGHGTLVRVRLDRSVANPAWSSLFPNSHVDNGIISNSDHMGVLVDLAPSLVWPLHCHKLFRFEHSWLQEEGCEEVVKSAWDCNPVGTALFCLAQKIKNTRVQLLLWSQAKLRITSKLIESTRKKLMVLEEQTQESYDVAEVKLVRKELHSLLAKEETHWRQRSRVSWLREGDRNSKFYHACAS
jgi:hypothetical protein